MHVTQAGRAALCLFVFLGTLESLLGPGSRKLSAPLPVEVGGSVTTFVVAPDDSRIAYIGQLFGSGEDGLFSAPTDGSQVSIDLVPPGNQGNLGIYEYRVTPDGGVSSTAPTRIRTTSSSSSARPWTAARPRPS